MIDEIHQHIRDVMGRRLAEETDKAFGITATTNTANASAAFTYNDLLAAKKILDDATKDLPPVPRIDLWPHDVPGIGIVELMPGMFCSFGRRQIVVPRARLEECAIELRKAGVDVRVQPRYGFAEQESDQPKETPT